MQPLLDWWTSPIWVGFGVVLLLMVVVIIGITARSHGTTVMKE